MLRDKLAILRPMSETPVQQTKEVNQSTYLHKEFIDKHDLLTNLFSLEDYSQYLFYSIVWSRILVL